MKPKRTTEACENFMKKIPTVLLKKPETFNNLNTLAHFWEDVSNQDKDRFSNRVLKKLFVLNYAQMECGLICFSIFYAE